jgi:hypothetical protein
VANPNVVADSFGGGGGRSTPPDFYSTMAARQKPTAPTAEKKEGPGDEAIKALQAVFEVFKKLEAKLGGKPDPNLDAAKDALKKFVAATLKQDPATLEGGEKKPEGNPPPPTEGGSAPPPPPEGAA